MALPAKKMSQVSIGKGAVRAANLCGLHEVEKYLLSQPGIENLFLSYTTQSLVMVNCDIQVHK
jgi:hypothetical protein